MKKTIAILQEAEIATIFDQAKTAQEQAKDLKEALADKMQAWISKKLPIGTVIDLRLDKGKPKPEYLHNVHVVSGNGRNTKLFRIEKIRYVEPNVLHPDLSHWYAHATPISMTTGKDMSSAAGNSRHAAGKEFLGIRGNFGFETYDD